MEVLFFTGNSGSGKSTIAREVCETRHGVHLIEREISRAIARKLGFGRSRHWVEDVGIDQAAAVIRHQTINLLARHPESLVIVDGVYDPLLPEEVRKNITRIELGIVAVEAPLAVRTERICRRLGLLSLEAAAIEISYLDDIKSAVGMAAVINQADLRITNTGDIEEACQQVYVLLESHSKLGQSSPIA